MIAYDNQAPKHRCFSLCNNHWKTIYLYFSFYRSSDQDDKDIVYMWNRLNLTFNCLIRKETRRPRSKTRLNREHVPSRNISYVRCEMQLRYNLWPLMYTSCNVDNPLAFCDDVSYFLYSLFRFAPVTPLSIGSQINLSKPSFQLYVSENYGKVVKRGNTFPLVFVLCFSFSSSLCPSFESRPTGIHLRWYSIVAATIYSF